MAAQTERRKEERMSEFCILARTISPARERQTQLEIAPLRDGMSRVPMP